MKPIENIRVMRRACGALLIALVLSFAVSAGGPVPVPPAVDTSALPALGDAWLQVNPYRGNADLGPAASTAGQQIFNQSCAVCHGENAVGNRSPAPDLRRLDSYCRRIEDDAIRARCMADVDAYFVKSVLKGKTVAGTVHMPAWQGVLKQEQLWSIKTFIESQRP